MVNQNGNLHEMKIRSIDRTVREVLSSNFYKIPRFQRPYSWDKDNIEDFWNDTVGDNSKNSDYFIGSMVVYPDQDGVINIVDGQQRMTTIAITLSALRDMFLEEDFSSLANGAQNLIEKKDEDDKKRYVLSTESSYPYFQNKILKLGTSEVNFEVGPEEENIQAAYDTIKGYIKDVIKPIKENINLVDDSKRAEIEKQLLSIRDKILSLKLILVDVTDEDDAYVIFETLNTRGKDLNVSDLLRNFFTKNIRDANPQNDSAKIQWQKILKTISESSSDLQIDTFLHHFWLSKYNYVTQKELFKTIKSVIKSEKAQSFLNELERDAGYYRLIHETSYGRWIPQEQVVEKSLRALQLFRVRQQTPLVLSIIRDYKMGELKLKNISPVLNALESFHFLFNAVSQQRSSGGISKMFVSAAIQLCSARTLQGKSDQLKDLVNKLKSRTPQEDVFKANFREILYTDSNTKQKALVRYILSNLDAYYRLNATVNYNLMTIEHLYPQSPKQNPVPEEIVGQFGNLIFVTPETNGKLSNKSFEEKVKVLKAENYPMDEILSNSTSWNEDAIKLRTDHLAEKAFKEIWKL